MQYVTAASAILGRVQQEQEQVGSLFHSAHLTQVRRGRALHSWSHWWTPSLRSPRKGSKWRWTKVSGLTARSGSRRELDMGLLIGTEGRYQDPQGRQAAASLPNATQMPADPHAQRGTLREAMAETM